MNSYNIRQLRESRGWSQAQVTQALGIKAKAYAAIEAGTRQLRITHLLVLAELYDVSVDYITGRTENPEPYSKPLPPRRH